MAVPDIAGMMTRVYETLDEMELQSPMAADFYASFLEAQFSQATGANIKIRSSAERALHERQMRLAELEITEKESRARVNAAAGFLMDNAGEKMENLFGPGAGKTTLEEAMGVPLDESLFANPQHLIKATEAMASLGIGIEPLTHSDLLASEFTKAAAQQTREERERKELAAEVKQQGDLTKDLEFRSQIIAGDPDNPVSALLDMNLKAMEEATGNDLRSFAFFDNDAIDTASGSAAYIKAVLQTADQIEGDGGDRGKTLLSILQSETGKRMLSELRDIPGEAGTGKLRIVPDKGGLFGIGSLPAEAVGHYALLLDETSRALGISDAELMSMLGLPYTGFDEGEMDRLRTVLGDR